MSTVERLKTEIEALSPAERAEIAEFLVATLDGPDAGFDVEWKAEIARRVADIKAGRVVGRPGAAVMAELAEKYP